MLELVKLGFRQFKFKAHNKDFSHEQEVPRKVTLERSHRKMGAICVPVIRFRKPILEYDWRNVLKPERIRLGFVKIAVFSYVR